MCGIAGYIGENVSGFSLDNILKHRGPDSSGTFVEENVLLLHHRLAIMDPTDRGSQPMESHCGRFVIVFNGMIYNFRELKRDLERKGISFRTNTDTEVVVNGYSALGKDIFPMLRGMFALAIYDKDTGQLVLARDPFGIKPLVYWYRHKEFAFASEIKWLVKKINTSFEPNVDALYLFLHLGYIPAPHSAFKHIYKLEPGHLLVFDGENVSIEEFEVIKQPNQLFNSYDEATRNVKDAILDSVNHHLVSDVPVATFLSGGLDSALITAIAKDFIPDITAFTIAFPGSLQDETQEASETAKAIGVRHEIIPLDSQRFIDLSHQILDHLDEPFADYSIIAEALVCRETAQHVKVVLSGDGADELWGGYLRYNAYATIVKYGWLLKPFKFLGTFLPDTGRKTTLSYWNLRLKKLLGAVDNDFVNTWYNLIKIFDLTRGREEIIQILKRYFAESLGSGKGLLEFPLWFDINYTLPYDMLAKVDTASMMWGLEIRVPFVDKVVVDTALKVHPEWKYDTRHRKKILRDIARTWLPEHVINRPKKGFEPPLARMLKHLPDIESLQKGIPVKDLFPDWNIIVKQAQRNEHKTWALISLLYWIKKFFFPAG
ncbi:MAG: asparagine synthase (glutamine-hydrolyzing) [Chlorobi bacterium]|nr:asparagine synthase (glutamine-hydrolyzing) [Chlorobiota bacterium]